MEKKEKIRKIIKEVLFKLIGRMGNFIYAWTKMAVRLCIRFVIIVRKIGLGMLAVIGELVRLLFRFSFIGISANCMKI